MTNLIIYQKIYDFTLYVFPIINRFPKSQKFVLGQQIENCLINLTKQIIHANKLRNKISKLYEIDIELEKLRFLIRLTKDLKFINVERYGHFCKLTDEIGKLLGGWLKSCTQT